MTIGQTGVEQQIQIDSGMAWLERRREFLARANRENVAWESGILTIRGNPDIRAGRYMVIDRGGFRQTVYIHTATHVFHPYGTYTTICQFDRGTGWIERQRQPWNPALTERAQTSWWLQ
jgi:hypothetical protein